MAEAKGINPDITTEMTTPEIVTSMGGPVGPHSCPVLPGPKALRERRSLLIAATTLMRGPGSNSPGSSHAP